MNREPYILDEAMRLMKRFNSYEKILVIARAITLDERVMVNHQVSLRDLTVEAGIPGDGILIEGNNIVSVLRHDGLLVDMVNESIEENYNITCDEISNKLARRNRIQVTRIQIQHVTRIRIQHVRKIRIHVTRIQIQHVMRIRILHVNNINLVRRRTAVNEDGWAEVDIIMS